MNTDSDNKILGREWILLKHEIGSGSLYFNRAMDAMEEFGKLKWKEAKADAARRNAEMIDEQRKKGQVVSIPFGTYTQYKP
jgi:hypothetical protein